MATILRSKLSTILLAARDKLVTDQVYPRERAKIALRMNPPVMGLQADNYAILLPLSCFAEQGMVKGQGRFGTEIRARLNVYPRNRNALDQAYDAEHWLTDGEAGILDQIQRVCDSLHCQFLTTPDGQDSLLTEPLRLIFWGEPHQKYEVPDWGDVVVEFECRFMMDLDITKL